MTSKNWWADMGTDYYQLWSDSPAMFLTPFSFHSFLWKRREKGKYGDTAL